ncbi:hypothetical protein [Aliiruegeria haliotis]|nr:hypothetical protein [Aliiruegeria haliotis]
MTRESRPLQVDCPAWIDTARSAVWRLVILLCLLFWAPIIYLLVA